MKFSSLALLLTIFNYNLAKADNYLLSCNLRVPVDRVQYPNWQGLRSLPGQLAELQIVEQITANSTTNQIKLYLKNGDMESFTLQENIVYDSFG